MSINIKINCFKRYLFFCINIISLFSSLFLIIFYVLIGLSKKKPKCLGNKAIVLKPSFFKDISDIIPTKELAKYKEWEYVTAKQYKKGYFNSYSLSIYLKAAYKHPFQGYYHLLVMTCLAEYTRVISEYSPSAIFTFADEKNFAKPLATLLCEKYGISHNGFMHGECFYQIDKGFLRFSTYFTWDSFYTTLFREMHTQCSIQEYMPYRLSAKHYDSFEKYPIYLTYYESTNNEQSLVALSKVFAKLIAEGKRVLYRPHPRFAKMEIVRKYIPEDCIQEPRSVGIDDSINQSEYIASICSTVLYESFCGGKKIVIDDYCDTLQHKSIASKGYIMMSKPHLLLSQLIKEQIL